MRNINCHFKGISWCDDPMHTLIQGNATAVEQDSYISIKLIKISQGSLIAICLDSVLHLFVLRLGLK